MRRVRRFVFAIGLCFALLFSTLNAHATPCSEQSKLPALPIWKVANHTVYGFLPYWTAANYSPEWDVLTHVAWFGESLSSTGTVSSSRPPPSNLLSNAHANGVKVPLTITCFNSTSIDSVLANYMDTAVDNIIAKVQSYGCDGVCINFEGVRTTNSINGISNKLLLQNFMEKLYTKCKTVNPDYHVSICAPAVDWNNVFRNANLTNHLDAFLIMGYDYFWSGSSRTGPVAPLDGYTYDLTYTVNTYLNYIPGNKIVLLLPFYGVNWPCESDSPGATTSGSGSTVIMKTAMANAHTYGRRWHNASSTPWYAYQSGNVWHQCWYDDTESLGIKFNLALQKQLQGAGMWALGYEHPSIWLVISQLFGGFTSLKGKKIAIDPGHGGSDTGATGIDGPGFPNEEDFNLDIALRLKELLASAGATVILTRTTDTDVSLQQRCDIANNGNADIFVSIHMNSAGETAKGTETFYYARSGTDYDVEGKRLAQNVQAKIVSRLGTYDRGIKGDYPYFGYHLYVLANTNMPAILSEVCFISNSTDFGIVSQSQKRTQCAIAIYEGICAYFGVTPVYNKTSLSITFPSNNSSVTGTVKVSMSYGNQNLLTSCRWKIETGGWSDTYTRDWFFNPAQQTHVVFNTYSYSVGWKKLSFELSDLSGSTQTVHWSLFFTRNLAFEGIVWGSSSAKNLTDDNDENYAAHNLGDYLYIALKCNHTIRAVKTRWWDGDNRYYQYKIEVSRDNKTWIECVNKTTGEYRSWQWDVMNVFARYLRITGTYNSANQWYHIKELQIFGRLETPYSVYGYVRDVTDIPVASTPITITNIATNKTISTITDGFGYYEVELNDLNFSNADEIRINLRDFGVTASFVVNDRNTSAEVSFTVPATLEYSSFSLLFLLSAIGFLIRSFRKKNKLRHCIKEDWV